jgi:formylglycine-generating enzyme required for sulfatase activity
VAKQVSVPLNFSIDATEVTKSQYKAWLDTTPSPTGQPAACLPWNNTYVPTTNRDDLGCGSATWPPNTDVLNHPVVCVDWCDARAYCKAVGKRLCGKIGGGTSVFDPANSPTSQWYAACAKGGNQPFPYGDTYDGLACNGQDYNSENEALPVGSIPACQSYTGVFDLSGNVHEWEDACDGNVDGDNFCRSRGGSFLSWNTLLQCSYATGARRYFVSDQQGFRCCSDP